MFDKLINRISGELAACSFIDAVVLGGSRATGTATEASDIDIGVYYDRETIDFDRLNAIAQTLDDERREDLICREGGWGNWVNCGGWLMIDGCHVDLILRDTRRVAQVVRETEEGVTAAHYQTGHPHAFINAMYRGELAVCKVLYAKDSGFDALKQQAEIYPDALQSELIRLFMFEAEFSCALAKSSLDSGDAYYVTGHLFRSVSALNQVIFALNKTYCLNEKKAVFRAASLSAAPKGYRERVGRIFSSGGDTFAESVAELERLCAEVKAAV